MKTHVFKAQKIARYVSTVSTGFLALFLLSACAADPPVRSSRFVYELLPEEKTVKVTIQPDAIKGKLTDRDKAEICSLVGRLKGIFPEIHRLDSCWDEFTVAARVYAGNQEIYCTKDDTTSWRIVRVLTAVAQTK